MDARLIINEPAAGAWNMAVDEALLEWAAAHGICIRFYQWSPATLSLGYFQDVSSRAQHAASRALPLVRRASGGGAIVHDCELTYSVVMPLRDRFSAGAETLVRVFHQSLIAVLLAWKIPADSCPATETQARNHEPFLCFHRRSAGDVLLGRHKIAGSAQRRHKQAVLQHGSVLLGQSPHAAELPGIRELSGRPISTDELQAAWVRELSQTLGASFCRDALTAEEVARAESWRDRRFTAPRWTHKRQGGEQAVGDAWKTSERSGLVG